MLRRANLVAKILNDAGLVCIGAFIAPRESIRRKAAELIGHERFLLVHLSAPIDVCRERDESGLYAAADQGEIGSLPGVNADYESPIEPDLALPTHELPVDACVDRILELLQQRGVITP